MEAPQPRTASEEVAYWQRIRDEALRERDMYLAQRDQYLKEKEEILLRVKQIRKRKRETEMAHTVRLFQRGMKLGRRRSAPPSPSTGSRKSEVEEEDRERSNYDGEDESDERNKMKRRRRGPFDVVDNSDSKPQDKGTSEATPLITMSSS
ncbi:hypothetical protein QOT17_017960 [Balamuthia mandrillaris]